MTTEKYGIKKLSQLTQQAKDGDQEAETKLYLALMPTMKRRALTRVKARIRNTATADEIAEDVVTSCILENLHDLKDNDYLIAWVTKCLDCACNERNDMCERENLMGCPQPSHKGECTNVMDPEEENIDLMMRCLDQIRPEYADILRMHYLNDLSYDDIAARTGMKMSTLIGRIQTARKELKYEMLARAE